MRRSAAGDRDLGGCIIFGHPAPRRNAETMPAIGSGAGLREQNRTGSTALGRVLRGRELCASGGRVVALVQFAAYSPFDPTPHTTNLYFIVAFKIARRTILPAPRLNLRLSGYLGMFRRLFNTRPWVATGRLLCSGGGGAQFFLNQPLLLMALLITKQMAG